MPFSTSGRNAAVDGFTAAAPYASLHSADPGSTGANEITGGSPAYARKSVTWAAAASGSASLSAAPVFDVPAGATVSHFGLWSAATSGTFRGGGALSSTEVYGGQGTYTLNNATVSVS